MMVTLGGQVVAGEVALDTYTETYQYEFTAEATGTFDLVFAMGNTVAAGNYAQVAFTEGSAISEIGEYKVVAQSAANAAVKTTKTFEIRESSYNYDKQYYIFSNRQNSMSLTASGAVNGAAVTQTVYKETEADYYFSMEYVQGNYFVLKNAASDMVISVKNASNDNAAKLVMSEYDPSDKYQQWSLMYVSQGFYSLLNRGSSKAIDVPSASYDSGIQLQQYDANSSNAQQWDIIAVDMQRAIEGTPVPDVSTDALWSENAIIYPLEKNLEPAGPMEMKWYSLAGATSYIVQIDDAAPVTVAAKDGAIQSYETYSVAVDTHKLTITGVRADGSKVATAVRTYFISKKGACWATLHRTENMNVSWYYNWGTHDSAGTDKDLEYIPMTWGNGSTIGDTVQTIVDTGYTTLLGFINMLKETHENWPGYPIWITEFGVAEWSEGKWSSNPTTVAQVMHFMKTVVEFCDSVDWVERYAWFPFNPLDDWGGASGIFNYDTGKEETAAPSESDSPCAYIYAKQRARGSA